MMETQISPDVPASSTRESKVSRVHRMTFGTEPTTNGEMLFRLWAPGVDSVKLEILDGNQPYEMERNGDGWHQLQLPGVTSGTRYQLLLPDGMAVPDPSSRYQPDDAKEPSEVIDPSSFQWTDNTWTGRPWHEAILYELHIGTFTPEGTFVAAIQKLDHLVELAQ